MSVSQRVSQIADSPTLAVSAKAKALKAAGEPVIGFGAGEPDFPTPSHIVEAAQAACADPVNHKYSAAVGLPELREAIAATTTASTGFECDASQVAVSNGGKHALFNIFTTLLDPGDEVLLPAPYWVSYPEQVRLCGAVPVVIETDTDTGFRVTVEQLEAARTAHTKVLIFVSPSNPTGAVYTPDEVEAIGRWAVDNDIWVVTDEIYQHLVYGDAAFTSMPGVVPQLRDRCVVTNGVAKTYAMTGWRVGWSIAPPEIAQGIARLQSQVTSNVNNVAQRAAIAALCGPQEPVEEMRQAFDRRRRVAVDALRAIDGVECVEPEGAFYVFPDFRGVLGREIAGTTVATTLDLAGVLLDHAKVALVPGEAFGAPGFFRLSYALGDDDLVEGIHRIATLLG